MQLTIEVTSNCQAQCPGCIRKNVRNPKTGDKVKTPQKKTIHFKMAKELFNKINNNE